MFGVCFLHVPTLATETFIVDEATVFNSQLPAAQDIYTHDFVTKPTFNVIAKTAGFDGTVAFTFTPFNRVPAGGKVIIELARSTIAKYLKSGSIAVWGPVESTEPPWIVAPLMALISQLSWPCSTLDCPRLLVL